MIGSFKQQEEEKLVRNAPLPSSACQTLVSLPLRAGLSHYQVKISEYVPLQKTTKRLKLVHDTAASLSHKSLPKRKGHVLCYAQSANCLLDMLQATMMLAKALNQLPPAPHCQDSCLWMNLLTVPTPEAGMAKEMTAFTSTIMVTTGDPL